MPSMDLPIFGWRRTSWRTTSWVYCWQGWWNCDDMNMTQRKHDWNASVQNYTHALIILYDTIAHHTRPGTILLQTARALTFSVCILHCGIVKTCFGNYWKEIGWDLAPRKKEEDQTQNGPTNGPYNLESHYYNCIENCVDRIHQMIRSWISPFPVHAQCHV
jgi:hypothetical protein